jgi:hypothetical protein
MTADIDEVVAAIDEYGGFVAGYKDWLTDQEGDDIPSPYEVADTLQLEYHQQIERLVIGEL